MYDITDILVDLLSGASKCGIATKFSNEHLRTVADMMQNIATEIVIGENKYSLIHVDHQIPNNENFKRFIRKSSGSLVIETLYCYEDTHHLKVIIDGYRNNMLYRESFTSELILDIHPRN